MLIVIDAGAGSADSGCSTTSGGSLPGSSSELSVSSGEASVCGFAWKKRNSAAVVAIRATTNPISARGYPKKRLPRVSIISDARLFAYPTQPLAVYQSDTLLSSLFELPITVATDIHAGTIGTNKPIHR